MALIFCRYLFNHQVFNKDKIITYHISGDGRDFIISRDEYYGLDENLFPEWFDIGKVNNEIKCLITNSELRDEIVNVLQIYLSKRGINWISH